MFVPILPDGYKLYRMTNNLKGFAYGIATSATFGLIPLFSLPLMERGMGFESILFYRFLFAGSALAVMLAIQRESFRIQRSYLPTLVMLGFFYTGSSLFLLWGYTFMAAGIATTLHFTYPIFVTLFMLLLFREKASWITLLAIGLAVGGVARLSIDGGEMRLDKIGVFIVLLSAVAYALYIVAVNKSKARLLPGRKLTFYVFCVSTVLFFCKAETGGGIQPIPDLPSFLNLAALALLPTIVSNITLVHAVHHIGSTLTAILGAMEPLTAVCIGVAIFDEPFTARLALGIALIITAVTLVILSPFLQKYLRETFRQLKPRS